MKRILSILTVTLLLLVALTACGNEPEPPPEPVVPPQTEEAQPAVVEAPPEVPEIEEAEEPQEEEYIDEPEPLELPDLLLPTVLEPETDSMFYQVANQYYHLETLIWDYARNQLDESELFGSLFENLSELTDEELDEVANFLFDAFFAEEPNVFVGERLGFLRRGGEIREGNSGIGGKFMFLDGDVFTTDMIDEYPDFFLMHNIWAGMSVRQLSPEDAARFNIDYWMFDIASDFNIITARVAIADGIEFQFEKYEASQSDGEAYDIVYIFVEGGLFFLLTGSRLTLIYNISDTADIWESGSLRPTEVSIERYMEEIRENLPVRDPAEHGYAEFSRGHFRIPR